MALTTEETNFLKTLPKEFTSDPKAFKYALGQFRERAAFEAKPSNFTEGAVEGATGGIKQMAKDYGEKVKESPVKEGFLALPKLGLAVGKQILGAGKDVATEAVEQPAKLWRGGKYIGKGLADLITEGELSEDTKMLGEEVNRDAAESIKKSANVISTGAAVFNPALSGAAMGGMPYAERQEQGVQAGQNKSAELGQVAGEMLTGGLLGKATDFGVKKGTGKTPLELADATPQAVRDVAGGLKEVADVGVAKVGQGIEPVVDTGVQLATKVFEPENVLQNMNRMTQKEISDFAKINRGKTPSEWLIERDIISPPEETIQSLAARADEAKTLLDDSLNKIEGTYTDPKLEVPIQELQEQFSKTRPFGGDDVNNINAYAKKLESGEGLTLAEANNLKRIYERNVKVNYLKDNNATGIDRANQVDSMLRNFIRNEAEVAGMPNVAQLSNEIQSSYTIANAIANRLAKAEANNPLSINDIILLGGSIADIKTGGAFALIRSYLGSGKVKTWFVKAATKGDVKAMKELPGVPTEIINIKNAERRAFEFQKWASENGLYSVVGKDMPKALPEGKTIQAPKASLESMSEAYRKGEMVQDGLAEVDKAKPKSVEVKGYTNVDSGSMKKIVKQAKDMQKKSDKSIASWEDLTSEIEKLGGRAEWATTPDDMLMDNAKKIKVQAIENLKQPFKKAGSAESALLEEAKKYKTADEFVKAQPKVYHGTPNNTFLKKGKDFGAFEEPSAYSGNAIYFTDNAKVASSYTGKDRLFDTSLHSPQVIEATIGLENPLTVDAKGSIWRKFKTTIDGQEIIGTRNLEKYAKENGYDGLVVKNVIDMRETPSKITKNMYGTNYAVFDPKQIKTKSQLKQIWEEANKAEASPSLINEAKKYKTADEFINSKKKIYHGTDKMFDEFDVSKSQDGGIWFTDRLDLIESGEVGASGKGRVIERYIDDNNLKLADWEDVDKYTDDQLINMGYDGYRLFEDNENTYKFFDPKKTKTPNELKQIWEEANKKTK
jgi:hypothetical protein